MIEIGLLYLYYYFLQQQYEH